ncbi:hypothetical protein [Bacteroides helcogenes]|uniref:Uncharacterized protein n=1 Tax=Bacteroides helcogenes (strain ATCC 35417 / DSM 20613 / JCM 6297 / CCUG 15421 / P 36-108) TaxID=693979 RepID=E6SUB9_BACT6|nr:hypothetical protein [Bacteroides helcogenes]ADV42337.1 hypothetical protein Bache_0308 [Bacteroides helcogenes P 36-108]MDY5237207.1 hypothetical protein [Bacteroides helcogenes]
MAKKEEKKIFLTMDEEKLSDLMLAYRRALVHAERVINVLNAHDYEVDTFHLQAFLGCKYKVSDCNLVDEMIIPMGVTLNPIANKVSVPCMEATAEKKIKAELLVGIEGLSKQMRAKMKAEILGDFEAAKDEAIKAKTNPSIDIEVDYSLFEVKDGKAAFVDGWEAILEEQSKFYLTDKHGIEVYEKAKLLLPLLNDLHKAMKVNHSIFDLFYYEEDTVKVDNTINFNNL